MLTAPTRFFTEDHEIFREQVRNFVTKEVHPILTNGKKKLFSPSRSTNAWVNSGFWVFATP